jgi:hypothetical protein
MSRHKKMSKLALIGLLLLAVAGFAAAQAAGAADRLLLLQAKRFEGSYKIPGGETAVKMNDATADWTVEAGDTKMKAALAPLAGKPSRATLSLDGRTVEGKATIEGRTLTMEFQDGKTAYKFKLALTGRNEGEIEVKKDGKSLVSGAIKRV